MTAVALVAGCAPADGNGGAAWSPDRAAAYLDARASWWIGWRDAARDRGTFCVSCHTTLPYALARPALQDRAAGANATDREDAILGDVRARVRQWGEVLPYYGSRSVQSARASESRGTEAILNALILAGADARRGRLSDETRYALAYMWDLQEPAGTDAGAWPWLRLGLDPWEGDHGAYYGAVLAAMAVGTAPDHYAAASEIQPNLRRLRDYLTRQFAAQPLSNRAVLLWASSQLPGLVTEDRRTRLADELRDAQQRDGGWSLEWMDGGTRWWDVRRLSSQSDGYATGLAVLALTSTSAARDRSVERGLTWLATHQNAADGSWPGSSLNALDTSSPEVSRFMSDAATAYAVRALVEAGSQVR